MLVQKTVDFLGSPETLSVNLGFHAFQPVYFGAPLPRNTTNTVVHGHFSSHSASFERIADMHAAGINSQKRNHIRSVAPILVSIRYVRYNENGR